MFSVSCSCDITKLIYTDYDITKSDFVNTGEKIIICFGKVRFRSLTTMHVTVSFTSLFFMFVCGDYIFICTYMLFDENPSKLKGKSSPLNLYARLPNIKLLNVYARLPTILFLKLNCSWR